MAEPAGLAENAVVSFPLPCPWPFAPPSEYLRVQDTAPVCPVRTYEGQPWLVTRYADVRAAIADPRFSADLRRDGYPGVGARPTGSRGRHAAEHGGNGRTRAHGHQAQNPGRVRHPPGSGPDEVTGDEVNPVHAQQGSAIDFAVFATNGGRVRPQSEYRAMVGAAGFDVESITPFFDGFTHWNLLVAKRN